MYFDFHTVNDWINTNPMSVKAVYKLYTLQEYNVNHRIIDHNKYILLYTLEGEGLIQVDGTTFTLSANTLFFANAYDSLAYKCKDDKWSFWLFEFKTEPFLLQTNYLYQLPFQMEFFNLCDQTLLCLKEGNQQLASAYYNLFYSILVNQLKNKVNRNNPYVIDKSIQYMKENMKNFSVQSLASFLNIPVRTLIYMFNKELGTSPVQYFQRVRVELGKEYLEITTKNMAEIAHLLGYCNSGHFSAVFKQLTGVTPFQYRREFNLKNMG